jgi:hypothetical protein
MTFVTIRTEEPVANDSYPPQAADPVAMRLQMGSDAVNEPKAMILALGMKGKNHQNVRKRPVLRLRMDSFAGFSAP